MNRQVTRRAVLGGALGLGALAVGGCGRPGGDALTRLRAGGDILIGLTQVEPFGFTDASGRATGESPEVARAVVAALGGGGLVSVQVDYERLIDGLHDEQFDLIAIGLTITPLRCGQVAFSRPDYVARTGLLVPGGNPRGLGTLAGVARSGATIGVLENGAELEYARAAAIPDERITTFGGQSALFRGVADGRVDCAALTRISLLDEVRRNAGVDVEVTDGFAPVVDGRRIVTAGGFGFRPQDSALRDEFDRGLADLHRSGRWLETVRPFGLTEENLPPPELTTAELCARPPDP